MRRKEVEEEKDRKEEDDIKAMDGQLEKQRHIEREGGGCNKEGKDPGIRTGG